MADTDAHPSIVRVEGLTLAHGSRVIQRHLDFSIHRGEVLVIMGGSGCGKSTLLRHLIGLQAPAAGRIFYGDLDIAQHPEGGWRQQFGVAFQAGALWSSMTVGDNVMFPLEMFQPALGGVQRQQRARELLGLVGLEAHFDAEIASLSGGMRKRVAIARALALDPPLLYLDEPSAGLDPPTSAELDQLICRLRDELGRTVVMVSHELDSIFAVANRALFLDAHAKTMTALGPPRELRDRGPENVQAFFRATAHSPTESITS